MIHVTTGRSFELTNWKQTSRGKRDRLLEAWADRIVSCQSRIMDVVREIHDMAEAHLSGLYSRMLARGRSEEDLDAYIGMQETLETAMDNLEVYHRRTFGVLGVR